MAVWPTFAALAVLAFIGPVLAQNSPVMLPGVNSRNSSVDMASRVRISPSPDAQLPPNAESGNLQRRFYFPSNLKDMYTQPATVPTTVEGTETPSIVMMDDMDFDKMEMFGLNMSVAANDSVSGIAVRFGNGGAEVMLERAKCRPEEKTVVLDIPTGLNVLYTPSCVRLQRCGGCCFDSMLTCRPNKTEAINIKVIRHTRDPQTNGASGPETGGEERGRRRGRVASRGRAASSRGRRQNPSTMITVPEEQHIECTCQCKIQEHDCNPALQEYVPEHCKCQCRNSDEQKKCTAQPMIHYWDDDQCICYCLKTFMCNATLYFDHTTCSCVPIPHNLLLDEGSGVNPRVGVVDENVLDEGSGWSPNDRAPITFGGQGRRAGRAAGAGDQPPHA